MAKATVTPSATPPVRLTTIVAAPAVSLPVYVAALNSIVPALSSLVMVSVAGWRGPRMGVAAVPTATGLLRVSVTVSSGSITKSLRIVTVKVCWVAVGPNVSVPDAVM